MKTCSHTGVCNRIGTPKDDVFQCNINFYRNIKNHVKHVLFLHVWMISRRAPPDSVWKLVCEMQSPSPRTTHYWPQMGYP